MICSRIADRYSKVKDMRENRGRRKTPVASWIYVFEVIKWVAFVAIVIMLVRTKLSVRPSKTGFEEMKAAVTKDADLDNTKESDTLLLKRFYSLDATEYDGFVYYSPKTNMGAEELVLIRLKNPEQHEAVMAAFDARIATQLKSFEGYGVDQTELLKNAVTDYAGNYCLLYVGARADVVQSAFRKAL